MKGIGSPRVELVKDLGIGRVVVAHQLAVLDREALPPEDDVPDGGSFVL
jgi:hypothetical protein